MGRGIGGRRKEWIEDSGAIVNLAGENIAGKGLTPDRWSSSKKRKILNSRLKAGEAVNKAIESAKDKPRVLIQASAIGYYGTGEGEMTENSPPGDDFLADTAKKWEEITSPVEEMGVRRAIIRTGIVLSSKGGVLPRLQLPYKIFLGGPVGTGGQWYSWIHVVDEARAIRFLLENEEAEGPFNLTAPNPRRVKNPAPRDGACRTINLTPYFDRLQKKTQQSIRNYCCICSWLK